MIFWRDWIAASLVGEAALILRDWVAASLVVMLLREGLGCCLIGDEAAMKERDWGGG